MTTPAIHDVPGLAWAVCRDLHTSFAPTLPDWASLAFADAWRTRIIATACGQCPQCGAIADTPREVKTAAPGQIWVDTPAIRHAPACPAHDDNINHLELACSPTGLLSIPDDRPHVLTQLVAFAEQLHEHDHGIGRN